jgi:hypothetical protein
VVLCDGAKTLSDCDGDFLMKAMSVLVLAALGVAGLVQAQTSGPYTGGQMQNPPSANAGTNRTGRLIQGRMRLSL